MRTRMEALSLYVSELCSASKEILELGIPLAAKSMVWSVRMMMLRHFLAEKNPNYLAEFSVFYSLEFAAFSFMYKSLRGVNTLTSAARAIDAKEVGVVFQNATTFFATMTLPCAVLFLSAPLIFSSLKYPDEIINNSTSYFPLALFVFFCETQVRLHARTMAGLKKPGLAFMSDLCAAVFHVFFSYFLINGKQGFAEMGVYGYAVANAIGTAITLGFTSLYLLYHQECQSLGLFSFQLDRFSKPTLKKIAQNCLLPGIGGLSEQVPQILMTRFLGTNSARSAAEIAKSYSDFVGFATASNSNASSVFISGLYALKNARYRVFGNANYAISFLFSTFVFLIVPLFSEKFVRLFLQEQPSQEDIAIAQFFVQIQAARTVIEGVKNAGDAAMAGCLNTTFSLGAVLIFVFGLNSLLLTAAQFLCDASPSVIFSLPMTGLFLAGLTLFDCWYHADKPEESIVERGRQSVVNFYGSLFCANSAMPQMQTDDVIQQESLQHDTVEVALVEYDTAIALPR